ncbi:MAG: 4Fe-4S binding protein [Phycisphaerae bacterium]
MTDRPTGPAPRSLHVIPERPHVRTEPATGAWPHVRSVLLRIYRVGVIAAIVWVIQQQHVRLRVQGDAPIVVDEVRPILPAAAGLSPDPSEKAGLFVTDAGGNTIGYALRTSPFADHIKGYSGPTDTLVVLDARMRVAGLRIRGSVDTKEHVRDVGNDEYFMKYWNDKTWDEMAGKSPREMGVEGVSGASLTSMAIANGMHHRFKKGTPAGAAVAHPPVRIGWHDAGLVAVIALGLAFSFTHLRSVPWARRIFQVVLIGYLGLLNGQILAQSLAAGWTVSGVAWRSAPALALLMAVALLIPWTTRRAVYCSQICPHGAAQEWVGRLRKKKWKVPAGLEAGLRWLPPALVALVIAVALWQFRGAGRSGVREPLFELAGIEPFDAYLVFVGKVGIATIVVAIVGLVAAVFVPMAYCKYGCPTGLVLNFVRSHGKADKFGRRDVGAAALVLLAVGMYHAYPGVFAWVHAGKPPLW